jgi:outer membrane protein TolC
LRKYGLFLLLLIVANMLSLAIAGAACAQPVLTLEQFQSMAREQGRDFKLLDLSKTQAELALDIIKSQYGISSYYDSKKMKEDMEHIEGFIDERLQAIKLLKENIAQWEAEKEDPEADLEELERLIAQAEQDITTYQSELDDVRPSYSRLVLRQLEAKSREDLAEPQLKPYKDAVEQLEDALAQQPKLLDYQVEAIYLGLLTLARQEELQGEALELSCRAVEIEEVKQRLGFSTPLQLKAAQERLLQGEEALEKVKTEIEKNKRELLYLAGLPLDFKFQPAAVNLDKNIRLPVGDTLFDFTGSLAYRRAWEKLQDAREDLEDTSPFDRDEYSLAQAKVEEAEIELEKTLEELQKNWLFRQESLPVAATAVDSAAYVLEQAEKRLKTAETQFSLGMLTPLELEGAKLELRKAELGYYSALVQRELAFKAYLLAMEGIILPSLEARGATVESF